MIASCGNGIPIPDSDTTQMPTTASPSDVSTSVNWIPYVNCIPPTNGPTGQPSSTDLASAKPDAPQLGRLQAVAAYNLDTLPQNGQINSPYTYPCGQNPYNSGTGVNNNLNYVNNPYGPSNPGLPGQMPGLPGQYDGSYYSGIDQSGLSGLPGQPGGIYYPGLDGQSGYPGNYPYYNDINGQQGVYPNNYPGSSGVYPYPCAYNQLLNGEQAHERGNDGEQASGSGNDDQQAHGHGIALQPDSTIASTASTTAAMTTTPPTATTVVSSDGSSTQETTTGTRGPLPVCPTVSPIPLATSSS